MNLRRYTLKQSGRKLLDTCNNDMGIYWRNNCKTLVSLGIMVVRQWTIHARHESLVKAFYKILTSCRNMAVRHCSIFIVPGNSAATMKKKTIYHTVATASQSNRKIVNKS